MCPDEEFEDGCDDEDACGYADGEFCPEGEHEVEPEEPCYR